MCSANNLKSKPRSTTREDLAREDLAEEDSAEEDLAEEDFAEKAVRCESPLPVARDITSAFMTGPCSVRFWRTSPFGGTSRPELVEDHRFQRPDRFEILGRDLALGKHDFKLGLDPEH
jgi:hypothetical protein